LLVHFFAGRRLRWLLCRRHRALAEFATRLHGLLHRLRRRWLRSPRAMRFCLLLREGSGRSGK